MPGSARTSRSSVCTTTSRSGVARSGRITSARSKGASEMLPNVQRTDAADHVPVLADEVRELLDVQPGETVVDATFGAGGHSRLLAADLAGQGKLVAIDRDPSVRPYFDRVKAAARGVQTRFLRGDYAVVLSQLAGNGVRADAVLLDLGISSMQVDRPERGFSYATDAPLDMRMDPSDEQSAADRSEERRVGKECRAGWAPQHHKQK